eukprot:CCRYP_002190-RA/>CCRYP_002190-RA protein AED:0.27 eAED:0.27 QI:0/0/0/1/0/0.5/2/0/535
MIAFHADTNAILVRPFPSKHDAHHIAAYRDIQSRLSSVNRKPMVHILDNEVSLAFRQAITSNGSTYQLVPPHVHRRNAAERAIHTFKDHFLAVLAGTAPSFPADQWDLLIPHAELTLNLLRASRCNPTLSAWEDLFGPFNFDATLMGPAGCRVLIHSKATTHCPWDYRSHEGFYIVLNKESRAVAITDAIKFRHHYLPSPDLTAEDKIIAALQQLRLATKSPTAQLQAIYKLRDIFRNYATPVPNPNTTPPRVRALASSGQALSPRVPSNPMPRDTNPGPASTDSPWQMIPARTRPRFQPMEAQPIAARTCARLQATNASLNAFAALADTTDDEPHAMAMPVLDQDTGQSLEHKQLRRHPKRKATWDTSYANELGRLCQGIGKHNTHPHKKRIEGTNTFKPIQYHEIPMQRKRDITYTPVVCALRPQKADPYRTRITLRGDRIRYPGDCGTKTGSLETVKLLLNSVLSTPTTRFASFDISNFYLGTPLDRPEYARIKLTDIPDKFIQEYGLQDFVYNGYIYFEVTKGVYGLKQAG